MPVRKEDLRKVKITEYEDGSGGYSINGYFHEFGKYSHLTDKDEVFHNTLAIVELENGQLEKLDVSRIMFVERF